MIPAGRREFDEDEFNMLDYLRVLIRYGRIIVGLVVCSVTTVGLYTYYAIPRFYESRTTILPPRETGGAGVTSLLGGVNGMQGIGQLMGGLLTGVGTNKDMFMAILKSRTIAQALVGRFQLKDYYESQFVGDAVKDLQDSTKILMGKEGVISIAVTDRSPKMAADIANAYPVELDRFLAKHGILDASRQRAFISQRIEKTEKELRQAEENLRRFQEKNKTIGVQEQVKSVLEEAARVRAQIIVAEATLESARAFATESNPQVVVQKRQIDELKRQLSQLQYGRGIELPAETPNSGKPRTEFHVPISMVPELGVELVRLMREVKTQEAVFTLLTQQYEQAKIAESKDTPIVQVLDKAEPPDRKAGPSSVANAAIAGVISLLLGVLLAFFLEYIKTFRAAGEAINPK